MLRTICVSFGLAAITIAGSKSLPAADPPRLEFTRMVAHWAKYDDPEYLAFIDEAEPELVQLGFYGGHFWSLAHTDAYKGYPAHLPVKGHAACGRLDHRLHDRGARRHGARAQIVPIGETAGYRDQIQAVGQIGIAMPDELRVRPAGIANRHEHVPITVGARKYYY